MLRLAGDILVVGLGMSGIAAARFIAGRAAEGDPVRLTIVDGSDTDELRFQAEAFRSAGVDVRLGVSDVEGSFALAVVSPGVPPHSPLMRVALESASEVIGELELAFRNSDSPWIAVTGTNGKTTTTCLLAHLLSSSGVAAETAGNIGRPAIQVAESTGQATAIVAEVSSFQLSLTEAFHPRVSVLLNITPDHVDWHGSMEAYVADKSRLFLRQGPDDVAVIDVDDPGSAPFADDVAAQGVRVVRVSRKRVLPGGAGLDGDMLLLDSARGPVFLIDRHDMRIRGDHNISNALAAAAAANAFGADIEGIRDGLRTFEPIEHRLEPAGEVDGVEYYNDSKATNPDAVLKALTAFPDRGVILLVGGRNKGNEFGGLAREACDRCKTIVTFGECGEEIADAVRAAGCVPMEARTLGEALSRGRDSAAVGDVVLLSPACASFDEFDNYADRGRVFKRMVESLARGAR